MKTAKALSAIFVLTILTAATTGCATYSTISAAVPGSQMVFSGTRLDLDVAGGNEIGARKFKAAPPAYPLIDLPFSVLLDTLIFPLTFSAATYEFIFTEQSR
jgi:uncharacterized protein YceK